MNNGGAVYMEGADAASHVSGTDYIEYFGAEATSAGASAAIMDVNGLDGTFTANNYFDYPYGTDTDYNIDELAATTGTEYFACQNDIPRAVYYNNGTHRTILSSVVLGGLKDSEGSNTKQSLMLRYLNYLTGTEASDIFITYEEIDFGVQYVDYATQIDLTINNFGLADLEITEIEVLGEGFSTSISAPITLEIGEGFDLPVIFQNSVSGIYSGTLTLTSNDPDEGLVVIPLYAECLLPPVCQIPGSTIEAYGYPDSVTNHIFTITNAGDSDLNFNLNLEEIEETQAFSPIYDDAQLAKGEIDWRDGYITNRGAGGPDNFGYKWKDSNEEGGPVFQWFDISGVGTNSGLSGDDNSVNIELPFGFDFYGEIKTSIMASTNGYLTFGGNATEYSNDELVLPTPPNDVIAPFWDDLHSQNGINYFYYDEANARFIIQYDDWGFYSGTSSQTFQVQLYQNGKICFLYESVTGSGTPTIGIENSTGDDGLQVTFNEPYVEDSMIIEFSCGPDWIDTDISSGTVAAGNSQDIIFTFNAVNFHEGDYEALAILTTNDPANPMLELPIILHVETVDSDENSIPLITSLKDNHPNPFNPVTRIDFALSSPSNVEMYIYNVRGQKVKTLKNDFMEAGNYTTIWNGKDDNNRNVASGIYYYRMISDNFTSTKKMLLLK